MSFSPSFDYSYNCGYKEPNIVKAKFIFSSSRIYTLEFDQNISMWELKTMIQKAARLHSRNFRLFSNGEEYTKYNDETFESFFHEQKLVVFHVEVQGGEDSEYLLEMNCPCSYHIDKFLLYYCYTCSESICSECFTTGFHKGHKIQDKCFYLLPTKFLVDKLFEKWNQQSLYQKLEYIEDQTLSKVNINKNLFDKLLLLLKDIQNKVIKIIEQYHCCNYQSFERIRISMTDIKLYSIKLLDDLKEKMNIKEIINNDQIFLDFDKAYKKLGQLQNDKFNSNIISYKESCQQIPLLIKNLFGDINDSLLADLNKISNDQRYDTILNQIKIKAIKSFNIEDIDRQVKAHIKKKYDNIPKKRYTEYMDRYFYNDNKGIDNFEIINVNKERRSMGPDNLSFFHSINNNVDKGNVFNYKSLFKNDKNVNIRKEIKINCNNNMVLIKNDANNKVNQKIIETTTTYEKNIYKKEPLGNIKSGNIQTEVTVNQNKNVNIKNIDYFNNNSFHSAQETKPVMKLYQPTINSEIQNNRKTMNFTDYLNDSLSSNGTINNINQIAEENLKNNYLQNLNNNEISDKTINSYVNNSKFNNNRIFSFGNNNAIPEEVTETENEANISSAIRKIINKDYILAPLTQTNTVKILTSDKEELIVHVKMPYNIGINSFLLNCAYCNMNKILYVTGGVKDNKKSNILLSVDLKNIDQINLLNPMNLSRSCHTMISYDNKYLFAVGGENTSSVERYNIIENIWENISPMNYKRMYPILAIHNDYLYALFGKSNNNEYCNTIERIYLNDIGHSKWEMVIFNNPYHIDTRIYGCGIYISDNTLFLIGGKCNEKTIDQILSYNFDDDLLSKVEIALNKLYSFKENQLYNLNGKLMQISDEKYLGFLLE